MSGAVADVALALVLLDLSIYEFVNILTARSGSRWTRRWGTWMPYSHSERQCMRWTSLSRVATRIASETGLSGYDAAFVGAAGILGVPLITADQEIAESIGSHDVLTLGKLRA